MGCDYIALPVVFLVVVIVPVVMQSDTVELLERVRKFIAWCRKSTIKGNALHVNLARPGDIHALTLFDVSKVNRVNATSSMWDDRRLLVPDQCPLQLTEERMGLDVRRARSCAKSARLVLDQ